MLHFTRGLIIFAARDRRRLDVCGKIGKEIYRERVLQSNTLKKFSARQLRPELEGAYAEAK